MGNPGLEILTGEEAIKILGKDKEKVYEMLS